ncbi:hypothetical protein AAH978_13710 [Streptomyces sp. ZYX-F-203]
MPHRTPEDERLGGAPALHPVPLEGGLVHSTADRRLATEHWLLSAHPSPGRAQQEWQQTGMVVLPLGGLFSAVRIPGRLVQAVATSTCPDDIDATLEEVLGGGPVICDLRGPRYYVLVPASVPINWKQAADNWRLADVTCLGRGTHLGVPRLDVVRPEPGATSYWSVPMPSAAELTSTLAVARLIVAGVHRLAEEAEPWLVDRARAR